MAKLYSSGFGSRVTWCLLFYDISTSIDPWTLLWQSCLLESKYLFLKTWVSYQQVLMPNFLCFVWNINYSSFLKLLNFYFTQGSECFDYQMSMDPIFSWFHTLVRKTRLVCWEREMKACCLVKYSEPCW